jgi:hypothetical protein
MFCNEGRHYGCLYGCPSTPAPPGSDKDLIDSLRDELARERESRKQAEDQAFNAGIEAALNVIAYYRDTRDQDYTASMVDAYYAAKCIHERVVHLKKPIPQEPAERERGK